MAENGNGSTSTLADFIWKNAEDLWGNFKHTDFGKIILPFTLLRRLECVLEPTREVSIPLISGHQSGPPEFDSYARKSLFLLDRTFKNATTAASAAPAPPVFRFLRHEAPRSVPC